MKQPRGEEAFDLYFTEVYGDRWPRIKEALLDHEEKVGRVNGFFSESFDELPGLSTRHETLGNVYNLADDFDLNLFNSILLPVYRMDPASLFPAKALEVQPGETVLDMCAAPGGKSLVLIEALALSGNREGVFVANELSARRRHRMMSVFKRYLPQDVRRMVQIRGVDGAVFGLEKKNHFDRILLDAPCSGERGVIQKKSELALWKPKRSKSFGIRQYSLLSSAFMALRAGGRLVYSTCSISPHENDNVIGKLHKRHEGRFKVLESSYKDFGEPTEYGYQFLPDKMGWGPIYYSIIEKLSES